MGPIWGAWKIFQLWSLITRKIIFWDRQLKIFRLIFLVLLNKYAKSVSNPHYLYKYSLTKLNLKVHNSSVCLMTLVLSWLIIDNDNFVKDSNHWLVCNIYAVYVCPYFWSFLVILYITPLTTTSKDSNNTKNERIFQICTVGEYYLRDRKSEYSDYMICFFLIWMISVEANVLIFKKTRYNN